MNFEIYLDIDGVLNRWLRNELSRRFAWEMKFEDWPLEHGWDIVAVHNQFVDPQHRLTKEKFWSTVTQGSWVNAGRSNLFDLLVTACPSIVGRKNVHVITTVPSDRNPAAYAGKAIWCRENLPEWLQSQVFMTTHDKSRLARPRRLLIDDADHNCEAWQRQGGPVFQIPRPWNSTWVPGLTEDQIYWDLDRGLRQFRQSIYG